LLRASRNVQRAKVVNSNGLNIYDLLYHEKLVLSRAAALELGDLLDPKSKKAEAQDEIEENTSGTEPETTEEAA
jgi:hypothetical protein